MPVKKTFVFKAKLNRRPRVPGDSGEGSSGGDPEEGAGRRSGRRQGYEVVARRGYELRSRGMVKRNGYEVRLRGDGYEVRSRGKVHCGDRGSRDRKSLGQVRTPYATHVWGIILLTWWQLSIENCNCPVQSVNVRSEFKPACLQVRAFLLADKNCCLNFLLILGDAGEKIFNLCIGCTMLLVDSLIFACRPTFSDVAVSISNTESLAASLTHSKCPQPLHTFASTSMSS